MKPGANEADGPSDAGNPDPNDKKPCRTGSCDEASVMKPQVETDSTYRRLQRFFGEFAFGYEALGRFLVELVPSEPPYVVVIDRTKWHFGKTAVNVLMIGIPEGGIAYPIA